MMNFFLRNPPKLKSPNRIEFVKKGVVLNMRHIIVERSMPTHPI